MIDQKTNPDQIILPPFLDPGDTIALTATARSISYEQIKPAMDFMENEGFKVLVDEDLFRTSNQFGGNESERAQFMNKMLANPDVRALWNVRGGYGTGRMVDKVDFSLLQKDPKWLIGFSDYSVILNHVLRNCNMASLHATMPVFMWQKDGKDLEDVSMAMSSLSAALRGEFEALDCSRSEQINPANFSGLITGGNLSVLCSIQGSASETEWKDKILFIEDLDEYYYHVDRMMLSLDRSGKLSGLRALLVGSFIQMHDHTVPFGFDVKQIIRYHCEKYGYPIVFDVNAGHHLQNMTIPFGIMSEFKNGILTFVRP